MQASGVGNMGVDEIIKATMISNIILMILSSTSHIANSQATLAPAPAPAPPVVNLTDLLSHAGPFLTFLAHIRDTQVIETFQDRAANPTDGITIFAPSDSAFSSLNTLSPPLSNLTRDQLQSLLLFHALPTYYTLTDLSKNLSGTTATTLAGARYSLNLTDDSSGTITVDSGWTRTAITSSVYSTAPVAVYAVGHVLIPEAIFGTAPPPLPPAPPSSALPPKGPGGVDHDQGPTPEPVKPKADDSSSSTSRAIVGGVLVVIANYLVLLISSSVILV